MSVTFKEQPKQKLKVGIFLRHPISEPYLFMEVKAFPERKLFLTQMKIPLKKFTQSNVTFKNAAFYICLKTEH